MHVDCKLVSLKITYQLHTHTDQIVMTGKIDKGLVMNDFESMFQHYGSA